MTEYVTLARDDAYFLLREAATGLAAIGGKTQRIEQIAEALKTQPRREGRPVGDPQAFPFYAVVREYGSDLRPLAVRNRFEDAKAVTDAYNLDREEKAAVFGYDADGLGEGERIYPV